MLALALPLIANSAVQVVLNFTDVWFIGRISVQALAAVGLPALCDEQGLSSNAREALAKHVARIRDWTAGLLQWHVKTTRYTDTELRRTHLGFSLQPTGLGTSAARIPLPVR